MNKRRWHFVESDAGFTKTDRELALEPFLAIPENKTLWNRLEESKQRLPWLRDTVNSLQAYVIAKGTLTCKQKSFATSLYLDCCITSDEKIEEQREIRKLGFRLLELNLGRVQPLVESIMYQTNSKPFSLAQIRALRNIANKQRVKLTQIPKLDDETFDGWFKTPQPLPEKELDNLNGLW